MEKQKIKVGDDVKIIGCPTTQSHYSNSAYEKFQGYEAQVSHVYANGDRNIVVTVGKYGAIMYYNATDLELINPIT